MTKESSPPIEIKKRKRNAIQQAYDRLFDIFEYGANDYNTPRERSLLKLKEYIGQEIIIEHEKMMTFQNRYDGPAKQFTFQVVNVEANYGKKVSNETGEFQAGVVFEIKLIDTEPLDDHLNKDQKITVIFKPSESAPIHPSRTGASNIEETKVDFCEADLIRMICSSVTLVPIRPYIVWGQMHRKEEN
jgi:hypothetical protein